MSLNAATLAFAIPVASKVANAAIGSMGDILSFQQLFGQEDATTNSAASQTPSLRQQLDSLSQSLRRWLTEQGVETPYEIRLSPTNTDSKEQLSVHGLEGEKVRKLLTEEPDRLAALQRLASSIQAVSNSLGIGTAAQVSITETDSNITY
jgi:hypothetical protein